MNDDARSQELLVTLRQKALFRLLSEEGITESGTDDEDRPLQDAPPFGLTVMVDMALSGSPSEEQLVDLLAWGDQSQWDTVRPLARRILALAKIHAPPA